MSLFSLLSNPGASCVDPKANKRGPGRNENPPPPQPPRPDFAGLPSSIANTFARMAQINVRPGNTGPPGRLPQAQRQADARPVQQQPEPIPRPAGPAIATTAQEQWVQRMRNGQLADPRDRAARETVTALLAQRDVIDAQLKGLYETFGRDVQR